MGDEVETGEGFTAQYSFSTTCVQVCQNGQTEDCVQEGDSMEFSSNVEMDVRSNFNLASQDGISDYILALSHTLGYHHVLLDVTDVTQQSALSYLTHLIIYGSTRERVLEIRASLDSMV